MYVKVITHIAHVNIIWENWTVLSPGQHSPDSCTPMPISGLL